MKLFKKIARWFLTIGLTVLGLLYLNSFIFYRWAASGPPTEIPIFLNHSALIQFGYSIALFLAAAVVFNTLKPGFSIRGTRIIYIFLMIIVFAIAYPLSKKFFLIDACLDSGGSWSEYYFECQK